MARDRDTDKEPERDGGAEGKRNPGILPKPPESIPGQAPVGPGPDHRVRRPGLESGVSLDAGTKFVWVDTGLGLDQHETQGAPGSEGVKLRAVVSGVDKGAARERSAHFADADDARFEVIDLKRVADFQWDDDILAIGAFGDAAH